MPIFYYIMMISKTPLKGLVHPKMKIVSVFTHPHVVPTPLDLRSSSEHKLRYF